MFSNSFHELWYAESKQRKLMSILLFHKRFAFTVIIITSLSRSIHHMHHPWRLELLPTAAPASECEKAERTGEALVYGLLGACCSFGLPQVSVVARGLFLAASGPVAAVHGLGLQRVAS